MHRNTHYFFKRKTPQVESDDAPNNLPSSQHSAITMTSVCPHEVRGSVERAVWMVSCLLMVWGPCKRQCRDSVGKMIFFMFFSRFFCVFCAKRLISLRLMSIEWQVTSLGLDVEEALKATDHPCKDKNLYKRKIVTPVFSLFSANRGTSRGGVSGSK